MYCPFLSIYRGEQECLAEKCAMWGVVGYQPLYPPWRDVGQKIMNGDALDKQIYGCRLCTHIPKPTNYICGFTDCSDELNEDTSDAQTAEPVKHGHWLETDAYPHHIYCSICYKTYILNRDWIQEGHIEPAEYCPHCGAKMDEADV